MNVPLERTGVGSPSIAVSFEGVSKVYPNGTKALTEVSFEIPNGSIHAICGENGAGKSTLMKVLFGLIPATTGQVLIGGAAVAEAGHEIAERHGIGMVHQHFSLIPTLTVTENIILGQEPRRGVLIDSHAANEKVAALMKKFQLNVEADALVGTLSVAAQQKVEILKALSRDTEILILDEPTAVLSPPEIEELFDRLRAFQAAGMTILFISHKLNEVRALAESVTVLRAGRVTGTKRLSEIPDDQIMQMVMGEQVEIARRTKIALGDEVLRVVDLNLTANDPADRLHDISLSLKQGEIVGVAGVDGSGQQGLVSVLSGEAHPSRGTVIFGGQDMGKASIADWRQAGFAHLPADRFARGGAPAMTVIDNALAGTDGNPEYQVGPFLRTERMRNRSEEIVEEFSVRCLGVDERLDSLSGGNAQKVIAARELATNPKFLIADQPTRGIDVAAAAFLHRKLDALAQLGGAILLVTADLDELLRLSDRIIVMFDGQITADIANGPDITPAVLGPYMLGLERDTL